MKVQTFQKSEFCIIFIMILLQITLFTGFSKYENEMILSVARNPQNDRIYFSTKSKVFAISNEKVFQVTEQLRGSEQNVSSSVIMAMKQAAKRQTPINP